MSCPHAHDDGAYVLGALAPAERLAFERHLSGCEPCSRSVRELAGLPGLLGRVDATLLVEEPADPLPETLLPALTREVRRVRTRRTWGVAGLAAAAAALVTAVVLPLAGGPSEREEAAPSPTPATSATSPSPTTTSPSPSGSDPAPVGRPMVPVGDVPVRARVTLEQVSWGTRLGLDCTYVAGSSDYGGAPALDYLLVVRTRDGRTEAVGSWRSVAGRTMHLEAATATKLGQIRSVEVRTPEGRVVLRLAA